MRNYRTETALKAQKVVDKLHEGAAMSEHKHTPGPWALGKLGAYQHPIKSENNQLIAAVSGWEESNPAEALANARLIAAAPELLGACEAVALDLGDETLG